MGRKKDYQKMSKFARKCKFIMEVGCGLSTQYLAKVVSRNDARMVTIDGKKKEAVEEIKGIEYYVGWSILIDDIPKVGDPLFIEHPEWGKDKKFTDKDIGGKIAHGQIEEIEGETNLIRKILSQSKMPLDFFFCDTGEYCGLAEWNIVKNKK